MLFHIVNREADHFGATFFPLIRQLRHGPKFGGAHRRKIFGMRKQNRPRVTDPIMERDRPLICFSRKIRNNRINAKTHQSTPFDYLYTSDKQTVDQLHPPHHAV